MKFKLRSLTLALKRENVLIPFSDVSYFYGQMGAGKTSIARLVDYCLGGEIELSPALQSELVGVTLEVELARTVLYLERPREADRVIAQWQGEDGAYNVSIPARDASGEVLPGTGVENLSDLLFWLSDVKPPKVRKSKTKDNTELGRLSIRDLLWYCYLDQDTIDSGFFHLDEGANPFKRLKSRDVLRFIIGFHQERVAQLEAELDSLRVQKQLLTARIEALVRALNEVGVGSEGELRLRVETLLGKAESIERELHRTRDQLRTEYTTHASERLREDARQFAAELARLDESIHEVHVQIEQARRHLHEIETLTLKFRRSVSARAVLSGVAFEVCPRCTKNLPERESGTCQVCGQEEDVIAVDPTEIALLERDAKAREAELMDLLERYENSLAGLQRERNAVLTEKARVDRELNEVSAGYDSAYLSTLLTLERERATLLEQAQNLTSLSRLPEAVQKQRDELQGLIGREAALREEHKEARTAAEKDSENLDRLKALFLDCLLRAEIPGITSDDAVEIRTPAFLPEVYVPGAPNTTVTSFSNMSSGGKKTLFKCCFAVAVHRLAREVGATLPEFLLIDSPMKNISERENREQFEGFHRMIYDLKATELQSTQIILIDKEYCPPTPDQQVEVQSRHMRPNDPEYPPLIPYYHGH